MKSGLQNGPHKPKLIRICGMCSAILTPKNTGALAWFQPDCNDCTKKQNAVEEQK